MFLKTINAYFIPGSIVIAGALVAAAFYFSGGSFLQEEMAALDQREEIQGDGGEIRIRPIDVSKDHIKGDARATVSVIEYSDLECPFCKRFHQTLQRALGEYAGKARWVYRHFPLTSLHSKAPKEAEASECADELGGNDAFWAYINRLLEVTPSNDGLDLAQLPQIAQDIGLNRDAFIQCLESGKYASRVAEDLAEALSAGGDGTPYTLVMASNGKMFPISGAQPYASLKAIIELALREK
ncbi:MAG: hypothetical protein A2806_03500 [Candidatus Terrybacteria bacterium RIFCSPHIGHO2_01_FULL_48_17]|uniref:Thioredoxin-like fold domain-containing protein n=1 Tax=Candidatus Terrybacteria bacterium RIFCSPHIGHO2_01_FULL_48_17 TaxID=1802362 RepID=A0A1G2PH30_9BACT|nr:MAG: hypothetical protein A2806_03500 [Candidatus Terrybacteria bacterium RIFCSPHIGHO2_01_FULL_48_17]OHA53110.1 MAG: hypothetical protein A3A30_01960 [Candidatus Terrybacteria bacterium RIFCSPLOWO2_01_FULL_48_14]